MARRQSFDAAQVEKAFTEGGSAFDELEKLIYNYLRKLLGDRQSAEDVEQETLKKVWWGWKEQVYNRSKLKSWVLQVAHNAAMDYLRKIHPAVSLDEIDDSNDSPLQDFLAITCPEEIPEEYIIRQENRALVWRALKCVSEVNRSCIILRWMLEFSLQEIADIHSCSSRQVLRYIQAGRDEFISAYLQQTTGQHAVERSSGR